MKVSDTEIQYVGQHYKKREMSGVGFMVCVCLGFVGLVAVMVAVMWVIA